MILCPRTLYCSRRIYVPWRQSYKGLGIIFIVVVAVGIAVGIPLQALARNTPYDSGSKHAYKDCLADSQKYLKNLDKGRALHNPEFLQGYMDTWNECKSLVP